MRAFFYLQTCITCFHVNSLTLALRIAAIRHKSVDALTVGLSLGLDNSVDPLNLCLRLRYAEFSKFDLP